MDKGLKSEESKMARNWTMTKKLESKETNGTLQLDDKKMNVYKNLLHFWPRSKVNHLMTNIENGVTITLFDVSRNETIKTIMKRVGFEEFHIEWDFQSKGYMVGDEIWMHWDNKKKQLCYDVLTISALRTYPQMIDNIPSSYYLD